MSLWEKTRELIRKRIFFMYITRAPLGQSHVVNPYCKSGYQTRSAPEGAGREEYRDFLLYVQRVSCLWLRQQESKDCFTDTASKCFLLISAVSRLKLKYAFNNVFLEITLSLSNPNLVKMNLRISHQTRRFEEFCVLFWFVWGSRRGMIQGPEG